MIRGATVLENTIALTDKTNEGNKYEGISFSFEISSTELCYSQSCGYEKVELKITVENTTEVDFKHFAIKFKASAPILIGLDDVEITGNANSVESSTSLFSRSIGLNLNQVSFKGLSEDATEEIRASLYDSEGLLVFEKTIPVTLKPMDFWNGNPQSISVFIERNSSMVQSLAKNVASALASISGDQSLTAYQRHSETEVLNQCAAIYSALQEQKLIYAEPRPDEAVSGQRIRSCNDILTNKTATCLDTTLLYCALAEHIGLHPLVCFTYGHAFPGVWLQEDGIFDSVVHDDPADITQNCTATNQRICILESTCLTSTPLVPFENARIAAMEKAESCESIKIVDVHMARLQKIKPLPQQTVLPDGNVVYEEDPDFAHEKNTPQEIVNYQLGNYEKADNTPKTRIEAWQRRLLDFSTRSPLMNVKISSSSVQILHPQIENLEDELNDARQFILIPNPLVSGEISLQNETIIRANSELLLSYFKQNKLPTGETEKTLSKKLSQINRKAQNEMSETGVNTLYLSVGHIEWTENDSSLPYRAPILLYPVNLIRKNKSEYLIALRDDEEPQLNFSIFEKFRNEFKYQTSLDYENLPKDDSGLDVRKIFAIIRNEISRQPRWRLVESCVLGLFSFDQFVMYSDMRRKSDELANNKVVASLIKGELTFDQKPLPEVTDEDFINEVIPVSLDETQMQAVKAASQGNSFILQGPPGTGKSQTITAMIVDAMMKGKKILFVAEKMAALQVVFRNLKKVNVSDYLLELHSTKVTKAHLIEQLSLALNRSSVKKDSDGVKESRIKKSDEELSEYISILHKKTDCGLSLYELINRFESLKEVETVDMDYLEVQNVRESDLQAFLFQLTDLVRNITKFRPISDTPYRYLKLDSFEEEQQSETKTKLQELSKQITELETQIENCFGFIGQGASFAKLSLQDLDCLASIAKDTKILHELDCSEMIACANTADIGVAFNAISRYQAICEQHNGSIGKEWHSKALELDIPALLSEWNEIKKGIFKGKQRKSFVAKIDSYSLKGGITEDNVDAQLRTLGQIISSHSEVLAAKKTIPTDYLEYVDFTDDKLQRIKYAINELQSDFRQLANCFNINPSYDVIGQLLPIFYSDVGRLDHILETRELVLSVLKNVSIILVFDSSVFNMAICNLKANIDYWATHLTLLYEWAHCNKLRRWFEDNPYTLPFMDRAIEGEKEETLYKQLLASYYKVQIESIIRHNPSLNRYDRDSFEEVIKELASVENEYRKQVIASIPGQLDEIIAARGRSESSRQEISRFIASNGKRRSIRSLFSTCSAFITDICPCLLMSPMSVSQFLEPGKQVFDIVVFDEASQIQTCKAIGAIARGKDLVVVGDSKQMPPTSFFKKAVSDDDEEYSVEAERMQDLESILDDCETLGLPSTRLSWHYRSNNESLIHFSNKRYYNHKLKTYPSIDSMESKVRLRRIPNGYYQPGDKEPNPFEAEAIVKAIRDRLKDPILCKDSIGVITFNEKQQNLIIGKLDEMFERNHSLAKIAHWDESELECPDKLIVKNLENIQGDERDVIMLSVTFGKSKSGRFVKNFGPIGKLGGEKRLNVAFSRARKMMEIYTVIDVDEFSSVELSSRGANDLREFLKYAAQKDKIDSSGESNETVRKEIATALESAGYRTSFDVGLSDFKIDIAVKNPKDENVYFCGIMLDGASMVTAHLTNDRFVLRRDVLKSRGWTLIQVRSIDWWRDSQAEIEAIVNAVNAYAEEVENQVVPSDDDVAISTQDDDMVETSFAGTYRVCELDLLPTEASKITRVPKNVFELRFEQVIEYEGPIIDDLLELRVLKSFGVMRRGKSIKPFLDDILLKMDLLKTVQIDASNERHYVFWPNKYREFGDQVEDHYWQYRCSSVDDGDAKRSIQDYPQVEIRNVMVDLIKQKGGYLKESLLEETTRKLGFKRSGSEITDTINIVYNAARLAGIIVLDEKTGTLIIQE